VKGYSLKAKVEEPFEWPDGRAYWRSAGVVRIDTDEGLVGWGPSGPGWSKGLAESVKGLLAGQSPLDTWLLRQKLLAGHIPWGVAGALDIALWDLKGKLFDQPVHRLLGGSLRERVPAYATGGYYLIPEDSIDWLRGKVQEAVGRGFRYYKMKMGARSVAYDFKRLETVQEIMGPEGRLAVDATTTYTLSLAMQVGRELQKRDILWFEDPLPAEDVEGYLKLADSLDIPVTAHYGARPPILFELLRRRAVDQVQPGIDGGGGFTTALQTMGMTKLHNILYMPSCWSTHLHMAATLHLLAVLSSSRTRLADDPPLLEFDTSENPLREDSILTEPIGLEADGTVRVPRGPGLGVEVLEEKLRKYAE